MPDSPTVAIVGAGAMGAMYAAHFASAPMRTLLVAAGERAERLRTAPLHVNGELLTADVFDPGRDRVPAAADLVVIAVKHHQLGAALADVEPLVGPRTTFISVLNGLDSEDVIADTYGADKVLLCIALAMDAQREGTTISYRQPGRLEIGTGMGKGTPERLTRTQQLLDRAGLVWTAPEDMPHQMWWKFFVNVGVNQASAVRRTGYGDFQQDGPGRRLMWALIEEVFAVAAAEGYPLDEQDRRRWDTVLAGQPSQGLTSMLQDVLAGRPTEVDIFAGRVVQLGDKHGIDTPYNRAMLWSLS